MKRLLLISALTLALPFCAYADKRPIVDEDVIGHVEMLSDKTLILTGVVESAGWTGHFQRSVKTTDPDNKKALLWAGDIKPGQRKSLRSSLEPKRAIGPLNEGINDQ
jgi:hypothetical protein